MEQQYWALLNSFTKEELTVCWKFGQSHFNLTATDFYHVQHQFTFTLHTNVTFNYNHQITATDFANGQQTLQMGISQNSGPQQT
jgi:hypothetical protein